jgi:hypothetical protein
MAGLSLSELKKRPGRLQTLVSKMQNKSAFGTESGPHVCSSISIDEKIFKVDSDNSAKIVIDILSNNAKKIIMIPDDGSMGIPISKLLKTTEFGGSAPAPGGGSSGPKGNRGDMAEAVFAAAITARFMTKNKKILSSDVHSILNTLTSDKMQQSHEFEGFNENGKFKDIVIFKLGLALSNLIAIQNKSIRESMEDVVESSIKFANSKTVENWAQLLYKNNQKNIIQVIADGVGDQTGTKVDVRVFVDDKSTDVNVSLKAGDVKQFGQVGGSGFDKQVYLWDKLAKINVKTIENDYVRLLSEKKPSEAVLLAYTLGAKNFNSKPSKKALEDLSMGVLFFGTSFEENVTLVQLNRKESKVYEFGKLNSALLATNTKITAEVINTKAQPEVQFRDNFGGILLTVRCKTETKPNGEAYMRNYVEKGNLMAKLVSYYS